MCMYRCIFTFLHVCVYIHIHVNETMMDDSTIVMTLPVSRVSVFK